MAFFQFINNKCVICKRRDKVHLGNIWMMVEESSRCVFHVQNMPSVEPIEGLNEETKSLV